ncbi:hypothetical protein Tco_1464328 [Tanacetum coccineum]
MAKQAEVDKRKCKGTSQRENRPVWNNVNRVNHQNQFVPTVVLIRTGKIQVNTARASSTNNVNTVRASSTKDVGTARHNFNSQAVSTNAARKVYTVKPIVNNVRPKTVFHKTYSPIRRQFNRTTTSRKKIQIKRLILLRHMTGNKAHLAEYQDYNGGPVAFGDYMETQDAHNKKGVSTEDQVNTVKPDEGTDKPKVSTDKIEKGTAKLKNGNSGENAKPTATLIVFGDDETIAEFLVSMSQNKAKQKGVEIKDAEDSNSPRPTSTRSLLTLKPFPKINPKDKGKKVLEEEAESDAESKGVNEAERKFPQLANDEEIARKVQDEWEPKEKNKKLTEEEATKVALINDYDDIQARIKADSILAARLQEEEREKFTIEERAKLLHDTIATQRRFLAQQRAAEIRSRPPTRTQLRNQMMTYLKHVGGKKHSDLKTKNFEEIQILYEKVNRSDENFIAIGSAEDERRIKDVNKKATGIKKDDNIKEESKEGKKYQKEKTWH